MMAIFVRRVAPGLDRLARSVLLAGDEASIFKVIGECMLAEILFRVELAPGFEHEHSHPALGQYFRRTAASSAGADNNSVIDFALRSLHGFVSCGKSTCVSRKWFSLALAFSHSAFRADGRAIARPRHKSSAPFSFKESAFARAQSTGCSPKGQDLQLTFGLNLLSIHACRLWMGHPSRGKVKEAERSFEPLRLECWSKLVDQFPCIRACVTLTSAI